MIILRKDKLNIVDPNSTIMTTPLPIFNFDEHSIHEVEMMATVLIDKMIELGGIGLSANQVGLPYRVFVMGNENQHLAVFNPEIIEQFGEQESFKEGCLSYPGLFMYLTRPAGIKVKYQNVKGEVKEDIFTGLTARVFQHEYDHMNGKDFTKGVSKLKLKMAKEKYEKNRKKLIRKHAIETLKKALKDGQEEINSRV